MQDFRKRTGFEAVTRYEYPLPCKEVALQTGVSTVKLLYQTHSPYARKALVMAHEAGLADR
ncbi:MAG: hypothetical protein MI806_24440, partial [Minwuiales bacterium]|nr:hypothetical protein [Minwuiales bacterium]